ncbi:MAG: DUF4265 domain-containing protein [Pseudomonadales bacterium]|nr:DUF4265 domain-containing protein [Pseudomonadales bacterium]
MTTSPPARVILQLLAGTDNKGQAVLEKVVAQPLAEADTFELLRTPLFIRNLAAGDHFRVSSTVPGTFTVTRRSGKLSIRVFRKENIDSLEQQLSPEVEKLGGSLDVKTERALAYSLHVNIGFAAIETLFDNKMAEFRDSVWFYGNIYDPADGVTPLHWWDEFLNQV